METQTATESKTFYSRSQGLAIHINKGERVMVQGELERIGEKLVEFMPLGAGEYGSLSTDDPEVIAKLEARAAIPNSDVMTAQQFNEQLVPDRQKVEALRDVNDRQSRQIEEQNRIIQDLKRQQGSKVPVPVTKQ